MCLKERLENLKKELFATLPVNRDFEFEADLENHSLGKQDVYRLHYMNYHRFYGQNYIGVIDWPFQPFMLPSGMEREDAFKVLSYLTDYIEENLDIESCSQQSVATLNNAIDLGRLGFKRLNINDVTKEKDIIDLFTVTGRLLLFKQSEQYSKYFEWYTEGITLEEVQNIYGKCGIEFCDLAFSNQEQEFTNQVILVKDAFAKHSQK